MGTGKGRQPSRFPLGRYLEWGIWLLRIWESWTSCKDQRNLPPLGTGGGCPFLGQLPPYGTLMWQKGTAGTDTHLSGLWTDSDLQGSGHLYLKSASPLPGVLWQPRGVGWRGRWEGGSRGKGHMYTYGRFVLTYGRNRHNIVKQLSSN